MQHLKLLHLLLIRSNNEEHESTDPILNKDARFGFLIADKLDELVFSPWLTWLVDSENAARRINFKM